jgi:hypothetical protein
MPLDPFNCHLPVKLLAVFCEDHPRKNQGGIEFSGTHQLLVCVVVNVMGVKM